MCGRTPILMLAGVVLKWTRMNIDTDARNQADAALRAIEERYRILFEKMEQACCVVEVLFDDGGKAYDCRVLEANPAFEMLFGLANAIGRTILELEPKIEPHWLETFGGVALTGCSTRFDDFSAALGRYFDGYAFLAGARGENKIAILFTEVTSHKKADEARRESEARFRVADRDRFAPMARGETGSYHAENRYVRKDGQQFWGRVTTTVAGAVADPATRTVAVIEDVSEQKHIELQLRESEARLQQALDAANAGVWELAPATGAFKVSPRAMKLYGFTHDKPINRECALAAIYIEDRPHVEAALEESLRTGKPFKVELRVRHSEGSLRWLSSFAEVRGEGERLRVIGLVQDIDERKRNEVALQESEFRLQLALDSGNIGIYEWRLETGELIWDDRLRAQWGLPPGADTNFDVFMRGVHPDDRVRVQAEIDLALDSKIGGRFRTEYRVIAQTDKTERWISVTGTAFFEGGRAIRMVGTAQDITERKRAEFERQKFVSLAEQSVEFIGICSLTFEPLYINPAGLRLVGLENAEQIVGFEVRDFFFPEDQDFVFNEFFPRVIREGQANVEIRFRRFDTGAPLWMLYNVFFLRDPFGAPIGLATVSRDITERKHAENALKAADQRKDEFLATLAHELRNPLAPIRNAVHVLRHDDVSTITSPRDLALLSMIDRQIEHLVRLVDDLLEVSRITRGKIDLKKQRVDLADVLRHAVDTAQPTIGRGGHSLRLELPFRPLEVNADPVRLAQVFTNLLNNAAKYTENGGVISLLAKLVGDEAVVTVRDSGVGIPAEMLPRVFDLFTQVDRTLGRAQGGLGIGLALVKRLLGLHGGRVEALSEGLGRGSAFVVHLPMLSQDGANAAPMSTMVPTELRAPHRILVIDDDHDVADSLVMFLETFGAIVRVAYSGEAGLETLQDFRPELIFLDLGMPKMDGYETARRIRTLPEGRAVKLVALTGWGQDQILDRAREAGFDRQLTKPAAIEAVQELLGSL